MPPPIPPRPVGTLMYKHSTPQLVIEVYLDYCCPFSAKMFMVLNNEVMPAFKDDPRVDMVFQNVPQPWHPQSAYMHEAALAVKILDESKFFEASRKIFAGQQDFFDKECLNLTRHQFYEALVKLVTSDNSGVDGVKMMEQLAIQEDGTRVSKDVVLMMKFSCKYHRVRGVHVTPTVFLNGVESPDISSSWTVEQWKEKIEACLASSAKL